MSQTTAAAVAAPAAAPPTIYVGLDVHKEAVTIAVLPAGAPAPTRVDTLPNDDTKLRRWYFDRLAQQGALRACYEASGAGYVLYRAMTEWGHACGVIAPSLIPQRPGHQRKGGLLATTVTTPRSSPISTARATSPRSASRRRPRSGSVTSCAAARPGSASCSKAGTPCSRSSPAAASSPAPVLPAARAPQAPRRRARRRRQGARPHRLRRPRQAGGVQRHLHGPPAKSHEDADVAPFGQPRRLTGAGSSEPCISAALHLRRM